MTQALYAHMNNKRKMKKKMAAPKRDSNKQQDGPHLWLIPLSRRKPQLLTTFSGEQAVS
jgi:hypothetical protein